jgi:hypothetical protein
MTYTDKQLELIASGTDVKTGPYYSSSIDLVVSPDVGTGNEIMAFINVETYTAGTNTAVTFDVVTSSVSGLSTTPKVIGSSGPISAADLEAIDDAGRVGYAPLVVKINPDHFSDITVSGVAERYLGLRLTHATADPSAMTVQAQFVECAGSRPEISHHASGFTIL